MGKKLTSTKPFSQKISGRIFCALKQFSHRFLPPHEWSEKRILMIMGCQRSGTTLIQDIFDHDRSTKVYGEFSELSDQDTEFNIRMNPLDSVRQTLQANRAGLIVLKPIVESQNALKLLEAFENAKILWMYRDFRDAAASNINMFGPAAGIYDLQCIMDNRKGDWRAEGLSDEMRETVARNFSADMPPHDAAALFWFMRNSWIFQLGLNTHNRVMIKRYEKLVENPRETIENIYGFIDFPFPGKHILPSIRRNSVGRGSELKFSRNIEQMCGDLLVRIDSLRPDREL